MTKPESQAQGSLRGTVRATDGAPIAGAAVALVPAAPDPDRLTQPPVLAHAHTREDGTFRFDRIAPRVYAVVAMASGFAPGRQGGIAVEGERMAQAHLRLRPGGAQLSGRVLDAGGGPVVGAVLTAVLSRSNNPDAASAIVMRALTDEHGRYRLYTRAGNHSLRAEASGYAPAEAWLFLNDSRTRDFELTPAARVSGRRARARRPARGRCRGAAQTGGHGRPAACSRSSPPAPTRTGGSPSPAWRPGATASPRARAAWSAREVDLTVNASEGREVEIRVDPAASVSGRVLDESGRPVANALAQIGGQSSLLFRPLLKTRSDGDGRYRIEGVLPGRYTARASDHTFPSMDGAELTVASADLENVDLILARPAIVEGRVLLTDGQVGADVDVMVRSEDRRPSSQMMAGAAAATDENGRFRTMAMPGKIQVRVQEPQLGSALEDLGVVRGGETRQVTLRLGPGGSALVSGQVTLSDGKPADGVAVRAHGGRTAASTRTDKDGLFTLAGLDPGPTTVEALADPDSRHLGSWNWARLELTLEEKEHRRGVALTLPATGRIAGRVCRP